MHIHTHMLRRRGLALLAVAVLGIPTAADVAAADDTGRADGSARVEPGAASTAILDLPGVDLGSLGYDGELFATDVFDPGLPDRLASPLPEAPWERVVELQWRVESIPPLVDELTRIRSLLAAEVGDLEPLVERTRQAGSVAQQHEQEAQRRAQEAEDRLRSRIEALGRHRQQMVEVAVAAYVSPPDADVLSAVLGGEATTTGELAADVLFTAKADHDGLVRDGIEVSIAVGHEQLRHAAAVAEEAADRVVELEEALRHAVARRDAHRAALTTVEAMVTGIDERLPGFQEDLEATMTEARSQMPQLAGAGIQDVPVVEVEGVRVHAGIAPALAALLTAAHADGVPLGGWGYRTVEQQINLRRAHCGPTPEDIFLKPAAACSPPTAQPGSSLHERGVAVDFHFNGRAISDRLSPGYRWLAEHAATYGFYNLPSEPWHWSVNGQ